MAVHDVRPFPDEKFSMPRRPAWSYRDTVSVVDKRESSVFREWMERVSRPMESNAAYFEGNLETWRQLWRVIERSDVLVLVADIRFPALHFVPDLYDYLTNEVGKGMVLALNKCDLVPEDVLLSWKQYFESNYPGMAIAMFSSFPDAKLVPSKDNSELLSKRERRMARSKLSAWGADQLLAAVECLHLDPRKKKYLGEWRAKLDRRACLSSDDEDGAEITFLDDALRKPVKDVRKGNPSNHSDLPLAMPASQVDDVTDAPKVQRKRRRRSKTSANNESPVASSVAGKKNVKDRKSQVPKRNDTSARRKNIYQTGGEERLTDSESTPSEIRFAMDEDDTVKENMITIGILGHPNAGKSSLINGVFRKKVVSTSRTPGHTKHLQTIFLSDSVRLCDCPGLVFPGLAPRELQILAGMYPIAQVREPYAAIKYLADRVPIVKILNLEFEIDRLQVFVEEPNYISSTGWTAWKICEAWAMKRGFRTAKAARLDVFRAANNILRLALDGRIVLATLPDGYKPDAEVYSQLGDGVAHEDDKAGNINSGKVTDVLSGNDEEDRETVDYERDDDEESDELTRDIEVHVNDIGEDEVSVDNATVSVNAFSLLEEES